MLALEVTPVVLQLLLHLNTVLHQMVTVIPQTETVFRMALFH